MTAFQIMKQGNAMLVLRLLKEQPLSRAELSRRTGLTRATITGIADELIGTGLVREGEIARTTVGRHPTMLCLAPDAYCAVGVDLSREGVTLCFADFTARPIFSRSWGTDVPREWVLAELTEAIEAKKKKCRTLGIGVTAPGPIDAARGCVLTPSGMEAWHGFSAAELGERLGLPVILEKDTAALAIAEKHAVGARASFLVLLADHGLGGGFIYNGRLFGSAEGFGCEIGHVCIDVNGPLCTCGNRGCAEVYASVPATLARAREMGKDMDYKRLVEAAEAGDAACRDLLSRQADALAIACVSAVNMLEPTCILLEGELCAAHAFLSPRIEEALSSRCFTQNGRHVQVRVSSLPHNGRAVAATRLMLENFFEGRENDDRFGRV
ncbi:MAG: ROK family transcriptional regulator [Clostridia bacterium]|nr:ROK family transcriptional regulator [Clostridia bacterium]